MSEEIINVLNHLAEQLGIAIDWTTENVWPQVMSVLGRYRLFELVSTSFWLIIEVAMLIIAAIIFKKMAKNYMNIKKTKEDNFWWWRGYCSNNLTGFGAVLMTIGILFAVLSLVGIPFDIDELFKWVIVPEIKYLEMLKGLMT